jgi:hypothetical protein
VVRNAFKRLHILWGTTATAGLPGRLVCVAALAVAACLPLVAAAQPKTSLTVTSAVDYIYANESLPIYVVLENNGNDAIAQAEIAAVDSEFFAIERIGTGPRVVTIGPEESTVATFRATPQSKLKPGSYTLLFDARLEKKKGERGRIVKALQITVRSPLQSAISPPTVTITAKPESDSLRESSNLVVKLLVENKSPLVLEKVDVKAMPSQALKVEPSSAVEPAIEPPAVEPQIKPFGSWDKDWSVSLATDQKGGPRYGKHTLFFITTYGWKYGSSDFTTSTVTPVEITAGFFGSEGFSQVFGVPLNLVVFVLPGFFLLFSYYFLRKRLKLVDQADGFTPATKDGIFYSVFWSVILIVAYKSVLGRDLYAFFTSGDLFGISLWGAAAGALIALGLWVKKFLEERRKLSDEKEKARWRFSQDDKPLQVLQKALHRRPDADNYQEALVKEGDVEWKGILLETSPERIVLGAQLRVKAAKAVGQRLENLKPGDENAAKAFLLQLEEAIREGQAAIGIGADKPIQRGGETQGDHIKILAAQSQLKTEGAVALIDFKYD